MVDEQLLERTLDFLVSQDSPSGTEAVLAEGFAAYAQRYGLTGRTHAVGDGRASCLITSSNGVGRHVVLSGHIDTLPLPVDEVGRRGRVDERYFGPEVNNMKAAVAAMFAAQVAVVSDGLPGRITLLAAASECDTIGLGTVQALEQLGHVDGAINGEPTDLGILAGHTGVARVRVVAAGAAAHVSQPGVGVNAVELLVSALTGLRAEVLGAPVDERFPGTPIVNVGVIGGGIAASLLAPQATAEIDIRYAPGMSLQAIVQAISEYLRSRVPDGSVTATPLAPPVFHQPEPYLLDPDWQISVAISRAHLAVTGKECEASFAHPQIYYGSDAPHLVAAGIPTVMYGPGKAADVNRPDEAILWRDVVQAASVYETALRSYLAETAEERSAS